MVQNEGSVMIKFHVKVNQYSNHAIPLTIRKDGDVVLHKEFIQNYALNGMIYTSLEAEKDGSRVVLMLSGNKFEFSNFRFRVNDRKHYMFTCTEIANQLSIAGKPSYYELDKIIRDFDYLESKITKLIFKKINQ